jgi:hypothetical protein
MAAKALVLVALTCAAIALGGGGAAAQAPDLDLDISCERSEVVVGQPFACTFALHNTGDVVLNEVVAELALLNCQEVGLCSPVDPPAHALRPLSAEPPWTSAPFNLVTWDPAGDGTLDPGEPVDFAVTLEAIVVTGDVQYVCGRGTALPEGSSTPIDTSEPCVEVRVLAPTPAATPTATAFATATPQPLLPGTGSGPDAGRSMSLAVAASVAAGALALLAASGVAMRVALRRRWLG